MGIRRKARELALHCLYQSELAEIPLPEALGLLEKHFEVNRRALPYTRELVMGIAHHWPEINRLIEQNAANWRLDRMAAIDRNILRIGAYELAFREEVPAKVAIDEAIEIAKRFSTEDAPAFINGILDAIKNSLPEKEKPFLSSPSVR